MARDLPTSGDSIDLGTPIVTADGTQCSIALWARPSWALGDGSNHSFFDSFGGSTRYFQLQANNVGGGFSQLFATFNGALSAAVIDNGTLWTANDWVHLCATFLYQAGTSSSNVSLYVNGVQVNSTTGFEGSPLDRFGSGDVLLGQSHEGYAANAALAELATWSAVLTANEVAVLARGVSPWNVSPALLANYWPLWGLHSPELNLVGGGTAGTLTGTSRANGPPVVPFLFDFARETLPDSFAAVSLTPAGAAAIATAQLTTLTLSSISLAPDTAAAASSAPLSAVQQNSVSLTPAPAIATATAQLDSVVNNGLTLTPACAAAAATSVAPSQTLGSISVTPSPASAAASAQLSSTQLNSVSLAPAHADAAASASFTSSLDNLWLTPAPAIATSSALIGSANQASFTFTPSPAIAAAAAVAPTVSIISTTAPVWPGRVSHAPLGLATIAGAMGPGRVQVADGGFGSVVIQEPQ